MKAAIVREAGQVPVYGDFQDPAPSAGEVLIEVSAAAISPLVKGRAAGTHYSSGSEYPFVVGVDGVGSLQDGRRVYFMLPSAPFGSMAKLAVVPASQTVPVPDGLDDVTAAAIANPGMSSWAAFAERARLKKGETVLVNGATGSAGRLAVQIAKHMGAKTVIATGRNADALAASGADDTILLVEDSCVLTEALKARFARGIDVVIDYLWGKSAEAILSAASAASPEGKAVRYVQVGSASGPNITLPGSVLRSSGLKLMGSGLGSVPTDRLLHGIGCLLEATVPGGFNVETSVAPLSDVNVVWNANDGGKRTVLTVGP